MTKLVILLTTIALVLYDVVVVLIFGLGSSISSVLYHSAKIWPVIPFVFGVLMGHFFWPISGSKT